MENCRGTSRVVSRGQTLPWPRETTSRVRDRHHSACERETFFQVWYQYLALRDSHPLPTRHIHEPIGGSSSHFRISVSVLPFPYFRFRFSVFHLPCCSLCCAMILSHRDQVHVSVRWLFYCCVVLYGILEIFIELSSLSIMNATM